MNILKIKNLIKKDNNVKISRKNKILTIENPTENEVTIIVPRVFLPKGGNTKIEFYGNVVKGEKGVIAKLVNKNGNVMSEIGFNTEYYESKKANIFMIALRIMPYSQVDITKFELNFVKEFQEDVKKDLNSKTVIIVPGYPSIKQKYNFSFVHSKMVRYKEKGLDFDVLVVNANQYFEKYEFEGIKVCKVDFLMARNILQEKKYKNIIIHFFLEEYANLIDAIDDSNSKIYIYSHGADLIYRDINIMATPYFKQVAQIDSYQQQQFNRKDRILCRYNEKTNVKWIFGTNWARERAEETNNIKLKNVEICPCIIDEKIFKYNPKNQEDRKKIFIVRKFDNINTYSIDILVRTILELSKRSFFNELEFNIYGDGSEHDRLLKPLRKYDNVKIYKGFLSHEEIAEAHKNNGIALFPTRYETQGVSALEAAMSGLVVVTSNVAAVPESFDYNWGMMCEQENYIQYADKIEELYNNPDKFCQLSETMSQEIKEKYNTDKIIDKEIDMFNNDTKLLFDLSVPEQKDIVLTIAIPSYNVEKYIRNGIFSLVNSKVAENLEILIINDGSSDNTAKEGKELEKICKVNGKSIVKLIDKENGGHGSTINKGIELAQGKYFKLMDGDDYFDTVELEKLVEILKNEDVDIVLNNYVEDLAEYSIKRVKALYEFMVPGVKYYIEDLCDEIYGFQEWGPLLSTSTYKTEMLKKANFKISEKCFYVDMELNTYAFINAKTIKYYPLDIYVYFIGRAGQSVSRESYAKNYKNHEHVTLKLIEEYYKNNNISSNKKRYILNKIIMPLAKCQYMVVTEFLNNSKGFSSFDKKLKKYPDIYNRFKGKKNAIYRLTGGRMIKVIHLWESIKRRIIRR